MKFISIFIKIITSISLIVLCIFMTIIKPIDKDAETSKVQLGATAYGVIKNNYHSLKTLSNNIVVEDTSLEKQLELEKEINKHLDKFSDDYMGSISIPDIKVSDSIYKSKGDFYLERDFNKSYNELGEIYLDSRTGDSLTSNGALLNGHAVQNGQKFGNFKKILDLDEQPLIYIYDHATQKIHIYKILFVSLIDGSNSGIVMNFANEGKRLNYYKRLYETSIKQFEEPVEGSEFLLLNSCSYIIEDGRYVVFAKKED